MTNHFFIVHPQTFRETGEVTVYKAAAKKDPAELNTKQQTHGDEKWTFKLTAPLHLNKEGNMDDTNAILKKEGFEKGMYVNSKTTHVIAVIEAITQGEVVLYQVKPAVEDPKARSMKVTGDDLINDWHLVYDKSCIKEKGLVTGWSHASPDLDKDIRAAIVKNDFMQQLLAAWLHIERKQCCTLPLMIAMKPNRHVFATENIKAGNLVLVPFSSSLSWAIAADANPKSVDTGVVSPADETKTLHISPYFTLPKGEKTGALVPYWAMTRLDNRFKDTGEVNMGFQTYRVSVATVFPRYNQIKAGHQQERHAIPLAVNTRDILEGESLAFCDEHLVVQAKKRKALRAGRAFIEGEEKKAKKRLPRAGVPGLEADEIDNNDEDEA